MNSEDYRATLLEASVAFAAWPHLDCHAGRPAETLGQRVQRQLSGEPEPLPGRFFRRYAASVARRHQAFGRLYAHAIKSTREGTRGND